ncbi:hypothetical protein Acr_23g0004850 [Actinidia rufa]|uniref:pectinesterase n=1 Tax=Actinidia rufa TaxID=165716 RepID=A0A7J0GMT5_9ERIC|nr:hypothetical protein Acr_23g0004850 [Actinidia rufa]
MDSIKIFQGYGKVNPIEDPPPTHPKTKPIIAVAISLIVLLTVVIGGTIAALIHESATEPPDEFPSLSSNPTESLRVVCSVTQFPDSCLSSLNNTCTLSKADPERIFNLSLRVAMDELRNLSSLPKTLISKSNDPRSESALNDCADLFGDSLSQLGESAAAMEVGPGEKMLTEEKIGDLKTWISGAMTNLETCVDGLEEMGSTVLDEVKAKLQKSKEYISNSLAILSNIHTVLEKLHLKLH